LKRFKDLSIRAKLVLLILAVSLFIVTMIGSARLAWDMRQERQALVQEVSMLARLLADRSSAALAFDDTKLAQENLSALSNLPHLRTACLYRGDGTLFASYVQVVQDETGACSEANEIRMEQAYFDADMLHVAAEVVHGDGALGSIYLGSDLSPLATRFQAQLIFSGIALLVAILATTLLAGWVQQLISRPIKSVTKVAHAIEKFSDYRLRAKVESYDEVGQLALGFNAMLDALQMRSGELAFAKAEQETLLTKYRSLFDYAGDVILLADADNGRILDINPVASERYGYTRDEFLKMTIHDLNTQMTVDVSAMMARVRQQGEAVFESQHRTRNGCMIPVEVSSRVIELYGQSGFLCIIRDLSERKRAEQALVESESRFRTLLEQSPFSMQILLPDGRTSLVNPAWERLWGVPFAALAEYNLLEDQQLKDKGALPYIKRGFAGEATEIPPICYNPMETPEVVGGPDIPDRWVRAFIYPIKDNAGAVHEVVLLHEDVTEKKFTEDAIRQIAAGFSVETGETFFRHLVEHLASIFSADYTFIGVLDKDDPLQVSTLAVSAHGKIVDNISYSLKGTPCANVVGQVTCAYPSGVRQQFPEDQLLADMGADCYIATPLFDSRGKPLGILVVLDGKLLQRIEQVGEVLEIFAVRAGAEVERLRAEETVRKLSQAVEQSHNAVMITDRKGVIEYINSAFTTISGYTWRESIGQTPRLLKSGRQKPEFYQEMWQTILAGRVWHGELVNRCKDGSLFLEEETITPLLGLDGHITHYVAIIQDITERRQTEEALRRAQKMEAIGQLSGGIAHDFNNQLGVIIGYLDFLKNYAANDEKPRKWVDTATKATLRCMDLTHQLLSFSRRQTKEKTVVDLNATLKEQEVMIARSITPEIEVLYCLAENLWPTEIDPGEFQDAFLNLVLNARDAIPGSGKLQIETSNNHLDAGYAALNPGVEAGDYVQLMLSDTGTGMDKETLEHIFEPFFTTKPEGKGTGLGLAMVYGFVKRYGGHIKSYSEPGLGTTMRLYLPRSTALGFSAMVNYNRDADLPIGSESILIVDDEVDLLQLADQYLSDLGYHTCTAENAAQALEILGGDEKFDLLFSDVVMPGGMSGYELAQQATQQKPGLKVLLTSGFTSKTMTHNGLARFAAHLLNKPYRKTDLAQQIRLVLEEELERVSNFAGYTILVVDDEVDIQDLFKLHLGRLGCKTVLACNGDEAIAVYRQSLADGKTIDAIILDLTLPGGMGGKEVAERIRALNSHAKIIVSSGYAEGPEMTHCQAFGFNGALEKYFDREKIKQVLEQVLLSA